MAERMTVKGNAFNNPDDIYELQSTAVPITWLYQLHDLLTNTPAATQQHNWLLEDVTNLLINLNGQDAFTKSPVYLYDVTMKAPDGTIHEEDLHGTDDNHAMEEAENLWLDETCIAVKRGELIPEPPIQRIIWIK